MWIGWLGLVFLLPPSESPAASTPGSILISTGSVWKYLDTGTNLPASWRTSSFDDSGWPSGPAQLGYGEGDEATPISSGPDPDNRYITAYFRNSFVVTNASAFNQLTVSVLRDDGVVVYLNGVEVLRDNVPPGPINYRTLASTNVYGEGERTFYSFSFFSNALQDGANVLAVELHQAGADSPDASFDLQLSASNVVQVTRGPYLQSGSATGVVVRWRTSAPTESRVRCGTEPRNLNLVFQDATLTTEHIVPVRELAPDTIYFYTVGTADSEIGGADYFFITAPVQAKPTRIWAIGDAGTADFRQRGVRDAYYNLTGPDHTDVWLMLGDNAYWSGTDFEYQNAVFNMYPDLLRRTFLYPTIGNHETYSTNTFADFPYLHIFTLPMNGEAGGLASGTPRYYSFTYGNIHFVCLDSMTSDRSTSGAMAGWLQQDLAANTNEWLIAFWHHPPYSKGSHDSDNPYGFDPELPQMRENLVPILERYGVDLVLCGHSHSYERSHLMNGHYGQSWTLDPSTMFLNSGDGREDGDGAYVKPTGGPVGNQGAVYIVAGSAGQGPSGGTLNHPAMYISLNVLGSVVLDIDGSRLDARFLRDSGGIDDYYTISKSGPRLLRISSISIQNGLVTITWNSEPGRSYQVERATRLSPADWSVLGNAVPAATGRFTPWSEPFMGNSSAVFYRVAELP